MPVTNILSSDKEQVTSSDTKIENPVLRYSYPSTIEMNNAHTNYLIFHIVQPMIDGTLSHESLKTKQTNFLKNPAAMKSIGMIQMYMPALQENLSHEYSKNETTLLTDIATEYLNAQGVGTEKIANTAGPALEKTIDRIQQSVMNNQSIVQTTGQIHKQRNTLLYGGTSLREQTFTFEMRARNVAELKQIGNIIYMFRRYSSATRSESSVAELADIESIGTLDVPPIWFVEERIKSGFKPRNIDKFMMGPAVIKGVRVNKTPDQIYQSIANTGGDPVSIELEITIQEMIPTYSDFWDELRLQTVSNGMGEFI